MNEIHQAALDYCRMGFSVIPLQPKGKKPLIKWVDYQTRKPTEEEINAWAEKWPEMNIGLVTGEVSGIIAVDIDGPLGTTWAEKNLVKIGAQTTGKGYHVFYKQNGVEVKNAVRIAPEVDVRGNGGFVVIAPSIHETGKKYELHFAEGKTWEDLPDWEGIEPEKKVPKTKGKNNGRAIKPEKSTRYGTAALNGELKKLRETPSGEQNETLNKAAFRLGQLVGGGHLDHAETKGALNDVIQGWDNLDLAKSLDTIERSLIAGAEKPKGPDPALDEISPTEDGVAILFAQRHKDSLRFCHDTGRWFKWDGAIWRKDGTLLAFDWCRAVCREVGFTPAEQKTLGKASAARGVEAFARADRTFAVDSTIWDANPYFLGTPHGMVNLHIGGFFQPTPDDYITKSTLVSPAEQSACPIWKKFLDDATQGDVELQRFMQQIAGYALTGSTKEHALFFIYGPGGNGKSVFLNTITKILGDYATTAAMDTFTASKSDKHPTDLAMLRGARMVCASETEEGRAWAESKIKQMTGGDPITARFMRQDFFTFTPQFKLIIIGNHQPILHNVDEAAKRRFNIIPFIHKPAVPDKDLESKLESEYPAILRWMIEGCLDWQANGLVRPETVQAATKEYFAEQDLFGQWIEDKCIISHEKSEMKAILYASWKIFAEGAGEQAGSQRAFHSLMVKRGFLDGHKKMGGTTARVYRGISISCREEEGFD